MPPSPHLFCFGLGYVALRLADRLLDDGWRVSGTCRSDEKCLALQEKGITAYLFDQDLPLLYPEHALSGVTHVLHSAPPHAGGDDVFTQHAEDLRRAGTVEWLGYLSTTGVYGDAQGAWVDEDSPLDPVDERGRRRAEAERLWLASGLPAHVFRLSGIYGPGRSSADGLRNGTARRIVKEGQVFSRIHVDDIVSILRASIARPTPGEIFNCADDLPAPSAETVEYAANLLGLPLPPAVPSDDPSLSDMARSFYRSCRRVSGRKARERLGVTLRYPTYKEGLAALCGGGGKEGPSP
jgi:nucleoside-diphosphate-sugar epimerase